MKGSIKCQICNKKVHFVEEVDCDTDMYKCDEGHVTLLNKLDASITCYQSEQDAFFSSECMEDLLKLFEKYRAIEITKEGKK